MYMYPVCGEVPCQTGVLPDCFCVVFGGTNRYSAYCTVIVFPQDKGATHLSLTAPSQ
jgi:hypothetical protein